MGLVTTQDEVQRVVSASREIAAGAAEIFELIADPTQQPRWDGNDNLSEAPVGQRVHAVGDVFTMTTTKGNVRENHVVELVEARLIAWRPAEPGQPPPGHLWRWELEPLDPSWTKVTHVYDWTSTVGRRPPDPARQGHDRREAAGIDRPARCPRRGPLTRQRAHSCALVRVRRETGGPEHAGEASRPAE